jgi:LysR family transcriptional regulator, benzoate and cis,cis-muconate-responsive activator of ben and cat genes
MDDLDVRELRYFIAVAEELSFSAAAARLGITQPSLSRAVKSLEAKLGTRLFERTTRRVTLTHPAIMLLDHAAAALAAFDTAARVARRAAAGDPRLVVTSSLGLDVPALGMAIRAYHRANPGMPRARTAVRGWQRADAMLREGDADAALLRTPFDRTGLDTEVLSSEPQVALAARDHHLARQPRLTAAEVTAEPAVALHAGDETSPVARQPADLAQLLETVALGHAVALVPASLVARLTCPDVVSRPVDGLGPSILTVAWLATSRSLAVAAFVDAARAAVEPGCQQPEMSADASSGLAGSGSRVAGSR